MEAKITNNTLRAWVVKTGEPVPYIKAEAGDRLFRAGLMADALVKHGMEVTWITGQFDHQRKLIRNVVPFKPYNTDSAGPTIIYLPSRGYKNHIGLKRFLDHIDLKRAFVDLTKRLNPPDVIICAWPTIELADVATRYGKQHGIPVILDVRDLWPDVLYERIADITGLKLKGYFPIWEQTGKRAVQSADALISITSGMLTWAQQRFNREPNLNDRVFLQCQRDTIAIPDKQFWQEHGVDFSSRKTRLVWSGTLVENSDLECLLEAIELMPAEAAKELEFIFCGSGPLAARIAGMATRLPYVIFAGWVHHSALQALYSECHIGLMCYLDRFDFQLSIPNKVVDFAKAQLRILTNLNGEVARVFEGQDILISYPTGNKLKLLGILCAIAEAPAKYRVQTPQARTIYLENFDAARVMPDFSNYVENLVKTYVK